MTSRTCLLLVTLIYQFAPSIQEPSFYLASRRQIVQRSVPVRKRDPASLLPHIKGDAEPVECGEPPQIKDGKIVDMRLSGGSPQKPVGIIYDWVRYQCDQPTTMELVPRDGSVVVCRKFPAEKPGSQTVARWAFSPTLTDAGITNLPICVEVHVEDEDFYSDEAEDEAEDEVEEVEEARVDIVDRENSTSVDMSINPGSLIVDQDHKIFRKRFNVTSRTSKRKGKKDKIKGQIKNWVGAPVTCGPAPDIPNTYVIAERIADGFRIGRPFDWVRFGCVEGFYMQSSPIVVCLLTGQWMNAQERLPMCIQGSAPPGTNTNPPFPTVNPTVPISSTRVATARQTTRYHHEITPYWHEHPPGHFHGHGNINMVPPPINNNNLPPISITPMDSEHDHMLQHLHSQSHEHSHLDMALARIFGVIDEWTRTGHQPNELESHSSDTPHNSLPPGYIHQRQTPKRLWFMDLTTTTFNPLSTRYYPAITIAPRTIVPLPDFTSVNAERPPTCGPPPPIPDAAMVASSLRTAYDFGYPRDWVQYECPERFEMYSSDTVVCMPDGRWMNEYGTLPLCISKFFFN